MLGKISSLLLSASAACCVGALGLSFAAPANAQSYNDQPTYDQQPTYDEQPAPYADQEPSTPYASDYATDTAAEVGGIVVTPGYRRDDTYNGIPTERVYASRVVHIGDLDLSTGWGVHELHARVVRAATDACNELDNLYPQGLYPIDSSDGDCKARAIRHAMADAPIGDPVDGYYDNGY